jgi:hypothetical protein
MLLFLLLEKKEFKQKTSYKGIAIILEDSIFYNGGKTKCITSSSHNSENRHCTYKDAGLAQLIRAADP